MQPSIQPVQYDLFGGVPPHVKGSVTSFEAGEAILPHITTIASEILDYVRDMTFIGATCDEVEAKLKIPHQTASARMIELERKGMIYKSDATRKTRSGRRAVVYKAFAN